MSRSIRYEEWVQNLLLKSPAVTGVSQHVLEEFIRAWDERGINHERDVLEVEHAG